MPRTSPRERAECGSCSESFFESSMVECQGGPCLNRGRLVCKPCYNGGSGNVCPQCKDAPACDCCVGKESVRFSCAAGHKNTELVCDTCCKESECCGERYVGASEGSIWQSPSRRPAPPNKLTHSHVARRYCTACTKQFKKGRCPECAKADDSQLEGLVLGILTQEGQIGDERQELLVR